MQKRASGVSGLYDKVFFEVTSFSAETADAARLPLLR